VSLTLSLSIAHSDASFPVPFCPRLSVFVKCIRSCNISDDDEEGGTVPYVVRRTVQDNTVDIFAVLSIFFQACLLRRVRTVQCTVPKLTVPLSCNPYGPTVRRSYHTAGEMCIGGYNSKVNSKYGTPIVQYRAALIFLHFTQKDSYSQWVAQFCQGLWLFCAFERHLLQGFTAQSGREAVSHRR
jgi:hypothetical protein